MDCKLTTEDEILSNDFVGDFFDCNKEKIKIQYRAYLKAFHPDVNSNLKYADKACVKITEMYNKAIELLEKGKWEETNKIFFKDINGKKYSLKFKKEYSFELGSYYVSNTHIAYVLSKNNKKYYDAYIKNVSNIKYKNSDMEKEFKRYFPEIVCTFETSDSYVIIIKKTEDVYLLSEIMNYYNGKIPPTHVAWIISRLCNICCFLKSNSIVLNGLDFNSIFISPRFHSIMVYGGWWYSTKEDEKMIGTSNFIFNTMPLSSRNSKQSKSTTDIESVKMVAKHLLNNSNLNKVKDVTPKQFYEWINSGSSSDSFSEFQKWTDAMLASFGKRKFVKMEIDLNKIYK